MPKDDITPTPEPKVPAHIIDESIRTGNSGRELAINAKERAIAANAETYHIQKAQDNTVTMRNGSEAQEILNQARNDGK